MRSYIAEISFFFLMIPSLHIITSVSGAYPAFYAMSTGSFCPGYSGQGVNLTTHLNLEPSLKFIGSLFPFPICLYAVKRVEFACYVLLIPRNGSNISNDM